LPKPAPEISRPTELPGQVVIGEANRLSDPIPSRWTSLKNDEPIEAYGAFGSHFVYYRIPADPGAAVTIGVQAKDGIIGSAGGKLLPVAVGKDNGHFTFTLPSGEKELIVLHDKHGHQNGPKGMENGGTYGLRSVDGDDKARPIQFAEGGSLGKESDTGISLSRGEDRTGGGWTPVAIGHDAPQAPDALLTWYRMQFSLPEPKPGVWVPWNLHLEAKGNGFLYINGRCLGRYWQAGPQRDFYIPETWLDFGPGKTNTLVLNLRPVDGGVSVQSARIVPDAAFAEYR
jgi:hypothetical protein